MTRTIYLITAKSTHYSADMIVVAACCSKTEAEDIAAMIDRCSPSKHPEIVEVALRGEFGPEGFVIKPITNWPPITPPQPATFTYTNEAEAA